MTDAAPWPLELDRSDLQLPPGRLLPIVRWGAAIMHRPLTPVTTFDDQLARLAADMFVTMDAADGVGLAATRSASTWRCSCSTCAARASPTKRSVSSATPFSRCPPSMIPTTPARS